MSIPAPARRLVYVCSLVAGIGSFLSACGGLENATIDPVVPAADAGGGAGRDALATSDATQDIACPSSILCGTPAACCPTGEECIDHECLPACSSGVRCGLGAGTCCGGGEVCLDLTCTPPGAACADSFDCDEGQFCEPTLGRCLPQPVAPLCEVHPPVGPLTPVEEWHWTGWSANPNVHNVLMAPAVADVDADSTPDMVISAYDNDAASMLVILNGADGSEKLAIPAATLNLSFTSGVAVGNLDADPQLEIVTLAHGRGVVVLEHDGTVKWENATGSLAMIADDERTGHPALANLDADPEPEIVISGIVLDNDGAILLDDGWRGCASMWCASAVADMNGDGVAEVIEGRRVIAASGLVLWDNPVVPDGFPAVADIDGDGSPDVVTVGDGTVHVLRGLDGAVLFGPVAIPGGGRGGAPTVADFDGDGRPEIAAAGQGRYAVYDLDCTPGGTPGFCDSGRVGGILWDVPTQDLSSSITGSSVFDFEGDGRAEAIYNDECHLYVYDGQTGATLLTLPNSSRTSAEYPLVVDVDGDNNSEIVVPANNDKLARDGCAPPGQRGVRVFGDAADRWVRTRRVWNQHSYHVTNVAPDGTVPAVEMPSWTVAGLNNYRQNVQGTGIFNAPDLTLGISANTTSCPTTVLLVARVANAGSLGVAPGVPVAFFLGVAGSGTFLGIRATTAALLPGGSTEVAVTYDPPLGDEGPWDFYAVADDDGTGATTVAECLENNNLGTVTHVGCPIID